MLIALSTLAEIEAGRVTLAFRRWDRLEVGYRLSPRGEALLARLNEAGRRIGQMRRPT